MHIVCSRTKPFWIHFWIYLLIIGGLGGRFTPALSEDTPWQLEEVQRELKPHLHQVKYVVDYFMKQGKFSPTMLSEHVGLFFDVWALHKAARQQQNTATNHMTEEGLSSPVCLHRAYREYKVLPYYRRDGNGQIQFKGLIKAKGNLEEGWRYYLVTLKHGRLIDQRFHRFEAHTLVYGGVFLDYALPPVRVRPVYSRTQKTMNGKYGSHCKKGNLSYQLTKAAKRGEYF
jgi:hypothetical protein